MKRLPFPNIPISQYPNILLIAIICFVLTFPQPAYAAKIIVRNERWVTNGVKYIHLAKRGAAGKYQHLHILKVDYNNPKVEIRPAFAYGIPGETDPTSTIAKYNEGIAAVNGSFFDAYHTPHLPVGLIIRDGKIMSKSLLSRTAFGITRDRTFIFGYPRMTGKIKTPAGTLDIWGINRPRKLDESILYTPDYGQITHTNLTGKEIIIRNGTVISSIEGNAEIPAEGFVISLHGKSREAQKYLPVGSKVEIEYGLTNGWQNVVQAITGGPRLIEDGEIKVSSSIRRENFRSSLLRRNARTAVGVNRSNEVILLVAEKSYRSVGATYDELAHHMLNMDCVNAMGLDGGGGSTMYINGRIVNKLQDGWQRYVSNALVVQFKK